ncbi:MAG: ABC transporter permease [Chitinophagaceae bacterium]|nr:ABC transporter permease [Chitinophagaceae bacterium]
MRTMLTILANSIRLTFQELVTNKLRTALSLIGISFGIFCIIGVLATVNSLERNIQDELKGLGTNTIYIDKWDYSGGPDYPWWKFVNRPLPKFEEVNFIKQRSQLASNVGFNIHNQANVEYNGSILQNVTYYGITEEQNDMQPVNIEFGRFISASEFASGSSVVVMGHDNAENLFGKPEYAVGKTVTAKDKKAIVIGVMKKSGQNFIGWNYDQSVMIAYRFCNQLFDEKNSQPFIMVKGKDNVSSQALSDELKGVMRSIRKISPTKEDNFSLNDIAGFSDKVSSLFVSINIGGWAIGALSLIVGAFGIANIMFVTVKERTAMIGLKKAIGARKSTILLEFLLEAAIICIMGGLIGILLVYILTLVLSSLFHFPVFISTGILTLAISICIAIGILAGIIPASTAARMDPVVAIRSK